MHAPNETILITYDCNSKNFQYSSNEIYSSFQEEYRPLWQIMTEEEMTSEHIANQFRDKLEEIAACNTPQVHYERYYIRKNNQKGRWYRVGFVYPTPCTVIHIIFTDIDDEITTNFRLAQKTEYDELTGLLNHNAFCKQVTLHLNNNKSGKAAGEYAVVYFDVLHFKAINDMFGMSEGTRLLQYIGKTIKDCATEDDFVCRQGSDRFILFTHTFGNELELLVKSILTHITKFDLAYEITCNAGIYVTNEENLPVDSMIDRAILAHASIKGNYTKKYSYFTESMRKDMINEQEIGGMMATALAEKQFVIYYQPQYKHSTRTLVGAEALVRWQHPDLGLISPGIFIPIFEKNGFITKLDFYVFEQVCMFIRKCLDAGVDIVPISTNFSRHDIFSPGFVEKLEEIRQKYNIPISCLRVEVTESAIVGDNQYYANEILKKLHYHGYIIEMDDFGSGYSSLNVLKDIEMDILKLDMLFLAEKDEKNNRSRTILSSIVHMANLLDMPVIAEGVEDAKQADFLMSIGCEFIQGYLYSKPLPEQDYYSLILNTNK